MRSLFLRPPRFARFFMNASRTQSRYGGGRARPTGHKSGAPPPVAFEHPALPPPPPANHSTIAQNGLSSIAADGPLFTPCHSVYGWWITRGFRGALAKRLLRNGLDASTALHGPVQSCANFPQPAWFSGGILPVLRVSRLGVVPRPVITLRGNRCHGSSLPFFPFR